MLPQTQLRTAESVSVFVRNLSGCEDLFRRREFAQRFEQERLTNAQPANIAINNNQTSPKDQLPMDQWSSRGKVSDASGTFHAALGRISAAPGKVSHAPEIFSDAMEIILNAECWQAGEFQAVQTRHAWKAFPEQELRYSNENRVRRNPCGRRNQDRLENPSGRRGLHPICLIRVEPQAAFRHWLDVSVRFRHADRFNRAGLPNSPRFRGLCKRTGTQTRA